MSEFITAYWSQIKPDESVEPSSTSMISVELPCCKSESMHLLKYFSALYTGTIILSVRLFFFEQFSFFTLYTPRNFHSLALQSLRRAFPAIKNRLLQQTDYSYALLTCKGCLPYHIQVIPSYIMILRSKGDFA